MIKALLILILCFITSFAQNLDFRSPDNLKKYADHLYCEKDYLRAFFEYESYLKIQKNDTVYFKSALSLQNIGECDSSISQFKIIPENSDLYFYSGLEILKTEFLRGDYLTVVNSVDLNENPLTNIKNKIRNTALLLTDSDLPSKQNYLKPFSDSERMTVSDLYDSKINPEYKSEIAAGLLSIIPGAGKIYTEQYSDGITSFLITGLFAFLAYDNFKHDHDFRAWIFAGAGVFFYGGNIYGSIASAQIFNARVRFDFKENVKFFIENNNYFLPDYGFCK